MSAPPSLRRITAVSPLAAVAGGVVAIRGPGIGGAVESPPGALIGGLVARVVYADRNSIACLVPNGLEGGAAAIRLAAS